MEVNIVVVVVYKRHLSEKVGAACVQTLQVQLHTAVPAKTKTAPAAALTFTNSIRYSGYGLQSMPCVAHRCP
jgi:hypothetical protein